MIIDRSNYEIWLIDWLDGNLNDLQEEQLKLFLTQNPDLREDFEELNMCSLQPSVKSFQYKDHLKKSTSDLSGSQFELLCISFLENDITTGQQSELLELITQDPDKKRTFELIQKTKLTPVDITFKHRNNLLKRTIAQRVIRLSVIGLSVAAVSTVMLMSYLTIPRKLPDNINNTAQNILVDSISRMQSVDKAPEKIITVNTPVITRPKSENLAAEVYTDNSIITRSDVGNSIERDSTIKITEDPAIEIKKIKINSTIDLKGGMVSNTLIASNSTPIILSIEDDRGKLSKFISKSFREKILKETPSQDSPLKGYEIAEAGVTGLNKLFGWEMELNKKNDDMGELKSIYFSSRILKFNAPIRKAEPIP